MNIMQDIIDFLATKEVLIVLGILGVILIIYFACSFIDLLKRKETKKKLKNNTAELNRLVEEVAQLEAMEEPLPKVFETVIPENLESTTEFMVPQVMEETTETIQEEPVESSVVFKNGFTSPIEVQPVVVKQEATEVAPVEEVELSALYDSPVEITEVEEKPKLEVTQPIEKIEYKEEVYTQTEAQAELERITEELQKASEAEKNIDLTDYEMAQEENAIISLEELLQKGQTLTASNEITQYEDEGNEPISIAELEQRYQAEKKLEVQEKETVVEEKKEQVSLFDMHTAPYKTTNGYKPSPIISPIYGIEEQHLTTPTSLELENTANYEKLDEEIRKTNEFLNQLRELQKKLD